MSPQTEIQKTETKGWLISWDELLRLNWLNQREPGTLSFLWKMVLFLSGSVGLAITGIRIWAGENSDSTYKVMISYDGQETQVLTVDLENEICIVKTTTGGEDTTSYFSQSEGMVVELHDDLSQTFHLQSSNGLRVSTLSTQELNKLLLDAGYSLDFLAPQVVYDDSGMPTLLVTVNQPTEQVEEQRFRNTVVAIIPSEQGYEVKNFEVVDGGSFQTVVVIPQMSRLTQVYSSESQYLGFYIVVVEDGQPRLIKTDFQTRMEQPEGVTSEVRDIGVGKDGLVYLLTQVVDRNIGTKELTIEQHAIVNGELNFLGSRTIKNVNEVPQESAIFEPETQTFYLKGPRSIDWVTISDEGVVPNSTTNSHPNGFALGPGFNVATFGGSAQLVNDKGEIICVEADSATGVPTIWIQEPEAPNDFPVFSLVLSVLAFLAFFKQLTLGTRDRTPA